MRITFIILILTVLLASCRKDPIIEPLEEDPPEDTTETTLVAPVLPDPIYDYESVAYPAHILNDPNLAYLFDQIDKNQITNEGATLGRVLFYDKHLSANNTISCSSCHHQDKAFADGMQFSQGYNGGFTGRNSMAIINADINEAMFWDHRAESPEQQALMPIQDPVEMGMNLTDLEVKIQAIDYYMPLFEAAFGDTIVTANRISQAIGQFVKSIRSFQSKYDAGVNNNFANFTVQEEQGRQLFFDPTSTCIVCHFTENFGGLTTENIGLDSIYTDLGVGAFTGNSADDGEFKSVSLRNIELTGPYMHDGRFATLNEVMDHYSEGIQQHYNLDHRLTTTASHGGPPKVLNFTEEEKDAMVAFLKTLTDWDMVTDPKYSDPFPQ